MAAEYETVAEREIGATETVTWLDIGDHGGRPVLRQWQRVGHTPAKVIARYWLERVPE